MPNVKILRADLTQRGRFAARREEEMVLEVSISETFGERRVLEADHIYPGMGRSEHEYQLRQRELAVRDMARTIARRVEESIIEALESKAREARPVHITDAFKCS